MEGKGERLPRSGIAGVALLAALRLAALLLAALLLATLLLALLTGLRLAALSILIGTVAATGPGVSITIADPGPGVAPETITSTQAQTLKDKRCNVFVNYTNNLDWYFFRSSK